MQRTRRLGSYFSFCFSKKKSKQKKNEPGGFRFPPDPLKRPRKPLRFSWIFPAPGSGLVKPTVCIAPGSQTGRHTGRPLRENEKLCVFSYISGRFRRGRPMCRPGVRCTYQSYLLPKSHAVQARNLKSALFSPVFSLAERKDWAAGGMTSHRLPPGPLQHLQNIPLQIQRLLRVEAGRVVPGLDERLQQADRAAAVHGGLLEHL